MVNMSQSASAGFTWRSDKDGVWKVPVLRPYEKEAELALASLLPVHKRVIAVGPTGSGKTVIGGALLARFSGMRILWLAHRVELVKQALDHLIRAGVPGKELGVATGAMKHNPGARILVGSIETIRRANPGTRHLIVVDEAHRSLAKSYTDLFAAYPDAWVLGLTATPWRLDGKPLGDVFAHLYLIAEAIELEADGFLARPLVYGVPREKARELVRGLRAQEGDYSGAQAEKSALRFLCGSVVDECARLAAGKQTLVFATTRKHGRALLLEFQANGRRFRYLDAETPDGVRANMLRDLGNGEIEGIVNVEVLCEGVDIPAVKCVALARPTRSLTRFLQQCGRAHRPWKGERPIILDHAGNCWRLGLPSTPRPWSLEARSKADRTGEAPVARCESCGFMLDPGSVVCPECGTERARRERELSEAEIELELLREREKEKAALLGRLRLVARERGLSEEWCRRAMG